MATRLVCSRCGAGYPLEPLFHGCPACRAVGRTAPLFAAYDMDAIQDAWERGGRPHGRMWTFAPVLPLPHGADPVTLGEGHTPLLRVSGLGPRGLEAFLKLELTNPTGSYKDRLNSVAVSMARYHGAPGVVCSSTGNHGVSLAAYAAAAGMRSVALLPEEAPVAAAAEIRHYGGTALTVGWDDRGQWVRWLVEEAAWALSARNFPRALGSPYGIEGYKTIAYEIVRQLEGHIPDAVFMPTGGGDGVYGLWRGFKELHAAGIIRSLPRLMGCQPERSASVHQAFISGSETVGPVELAISHALSLTDRQGGDHALWAIRESGGSAIALSEEEIRGAVRVLGRMGLCVEPAGAAGVAGLLKTGGQVSAAGTPPVCILTGGGQRWPQTFDGA